jgi:hypothetical protein
MQTAHTNQEFMQKQAEKGEKSYSFFLSVRIYEVA